MKKIAIFTFSFLVIIGFCSFEIHKFYVSIYQINFNQKNKRLEITSRIFVDDLNTILLKKYDQKTHLGETAETPEDLILMKKYILDNLSVKINGQKKTINFLIKEMETNVLVCYYNIKDISSIKTFEIQNTCLLDLNADQQNIIQTTFYGKKETLLLTPSTIKGFLKL
jgi:hypothetical protein